MENTVLEGVTFTHIRQTIRSVILPLVQAIYDENPTDILMFCSNYFNDILQKRESELANIDHQNLKCVDESIEKRVEGTENQNAEDESKEIDDFPTNIQGSSSAPLLTTNKQSMVVNLRGTSSWDTPSNFIEPVKSLAVLKDAACGIGDQSSLVKKQIGLENDAEVSDTNAYLKDDSAFEDNSYIKDKTVSEIKNYLADGEYRSDGTEDDLKTLCTKFQGMKTSETSDALKFYGSMHNDFDQGITQVKDIKICRKELSPNSSFGFIPCLNEYDSEKKTEKVNSESCNEEDFQTKTKRIKALATKFSETFSNLADEISCSETNFNVELQNAKEISDIIEGRNNVREMNFDIKYDQTSDSRNSFIEEKDNDILAENSDKHELDNLKNRNKTCDRKMNELSSCLEVADKNMIEYFDPEEKFKKGQETKEDLTEQTHSQKEKHPDKENAKTTFFDDKDDDENNDDKSDHPESQNIVDKSWRKMWYEDHPPLDNFDGVQRMRRDPRLHRVHFPDHRSNIGEAGDVPLDKFHNTNGAANNWHSKNEITSESSTNFRELNYSRFFRDKISYRPIRGTLSDNSSERKISSEKTSNANPQNIPYSWRKLCKQSHSSENLSKNSKASQLNEGTDISSAREEMSALNGTETKSEIDVNQKRESTLEASNEIQDQSIIGKDKMSQNRKRNIIEDDVEAQTKNFDHNGVLSEALKDKAVNQDNDHPIKDEFGLNAACGDFVSLKNDANEHGIDSQTCLLNLEQNNENYIEQNNGTNEGISKEYLGEIIDKVIEQQNNDSKDSFEGLNFPCYSESDSSYRESSDFSEADDFDMNDNIRDT